MFLTSLTLRGFKSFADKTVLEVEPGITVIVGPNGSGKSNVVDALAWVLGTHSAKKVRGGSMSDVIFAGSPTRSALGQARVEIAIDNSRGQLGDAALGTSSSAQQFSEVRVSRTIYAGGENIYEINGEEVRALDVQELLSDTGLGKELHTIVGQGQLDEILNAKPEERRKFIEEAAGILKHRRRRERALRKLDQVDQHIDKLKSILRELRRQLRPLERQAEAANRYTQLQSELRDVQVRLAALELDRLTGLLQRDDEHGADASQRQAAAEQAVAAVRAREAAIEAELRDEEPTAERAQSTYHRLSSLLERLRGAQDLIEAKRKHLVEYVEEPLAGRPPAELRAQAERVEANRRERQLERDSYRELLDEAIAARREAEQERRAHEQQVQAEARRRAQAREQVLRWEGEVSALRGSIAASEGEVGRVSSQLASLDDRVTEAQGEIEKVQDEIQQLDSAEVDLTSALETAEGQVAAAQAEVDELVARESDLERSRSSQAARAEALRAALAETDGGTAALLSSDLDGVLGPVAEHVRVESGADAAIAAALGPLGEAVVVATPEHARRAVSWLRTAEVGSAVLLPARATEPPHLELDEEALDQLRTAGAVPVADVLQPADGEASARVVAALRGALARTYLVDAWDKAVLLHGRNPELTFVTPQGDVAGPLGYVGGEAPASSAVTTATAAAEAERRAAGFEAQLAQVRAALAAAREELALRKGDLDEATTRINESDARITGAAERLARLNKELHALANQRQIVAANHVELTDILERDRAGLSELNSRGPKVEPEEFADGPDEEAARLDETVEAARERELDARVRLERMTENLRHLELQADELRREADEVEQALAAAARRRELRRQGIVRCGELAAFATTAILSLEASIEAARTHRDELQERMRGARSELDAVRTELAGLTEELEQVKEARHAADLRRSDLEHQFAQIVDRLRREFSLSPEEVRAEHPDAAGYDRAALAETEDVLVRRLGLLGRVNPLALEEFKALEERHNFLSDQLDDLRRSKRDLQEVVVAVDERIREVFAAAYHDVAREFEQTFTTVFPGGTGRLVLTDPDDMLTTGIEVEARPPGKKVTRLSLLSGGERSLTVLAFVFAIFRARPSPFYVLDEVDAALDDVNLQRLLRVIRSFRGHSQIIMVTHQKRSMEIADVMYGITMGPDAVTKVVAERLSEPAAQEERMGEQAETVPVEPASV
ncbi:MAG: chromosome segregation protein SMC [Actinobacteria bacterium]|nr:chromosome segregation protein SMC [Actinomycetota bacterium]